MWRTQPLMNNDRHQYPLQVAPSSTKKSNVKNRNLSRSWINREINVKY